MDRTIYHGPRRTAVTSSEYVSSKERIYDLSPYLSPLHPYLVHQNEGSESKLGVGGKPTAANTYSYSKNEDGRRGRR
eukprot:scaffold315353_cov45-Tisochrysis_lutea.AAC.1